MASSDGEQDSDAIHLSRRPYVQALVGAGLVTLAGCGGGGGEDTTTTQTTTTTTTTTEEEEDTGGGDTTTEETEETTQQGEPVATTISSTALKPPQQTNVNRWAATINNSGITFYREICDPRYVTNANELLFNGTEMETPHFDQDSVTLHAWMDGLEVEPPFDMYTDLNTDLSYWDGTTLDARAQMLNDETWYYYDGNKFDPAATFNTEVVNPSRLHRWRNKGEAPKQQPDPTNQFILRQGANLPFTPFHPKFTEPFVKRCRDATTAEEVSSVITDLEGTKVTFQTYAEEGYGSSLYKLNPDRISAESMIAEMRDDHPNDYATIPELELKIASSDRREVLANRGEIDMGGGIVQQEGGQWNRQQFPDFLQEITRFLDNGNDQLLFNWNNQHIQNLWVRRAIVAAVDWVAVGANGWGAERTIPTKQHTHTLNTKAQSFFSKGFLDSLHTWPVESNMELAAEYMNRAGYSGSVGSGWTSPDGTQVTLSFKGNSQINDWNGAAQTIRANLKDFGFGINYQGLDWPGYTDALSPQNLNYDIAIQWAPGAVDIWNTYWTQGYWWNDTLVGGDPNDGSDYANVDAETGSGQTHDTVDIQGKPLEVQIPAEPGVIEAPDQAGANPDLGAAGIDSVEIDLADLVHSFRQQDVDEATFKENARLCARYYNYYLSDFIFHQYTWGLWGNVRDFNWPPRDSRAAKMYKEFSGEDFVTLAGLVGTKFNQEYEPP